MFSFVVKKGCEFYIILELSVFLIANGWNCLVEASKTFIGSFKTLEF
jgi:hypothetical protein